MSAASDPRPTVDVVAGPVVAGGDALVRREGERVLFADGALPGERVRVELTQQRKDLARGRVVEVLEPSPARVAPPCPTFVAGCGGCQWQHATAEAQQEMKVGIVTDALARIAKRPDVPVRFGGAVPDFGYRTTLRAAVVDDGRLALRRRQSNDLVPMERCLIAHPLVEEVILDGRFPGATQVVVRASVSSGERIVHPDGDGRFVLPNGVRVAESNRDALTETVLGRPFRISMGSFFQSGPAAAELLAQTVDALVDPDADWIIDAYAGVGVLGAITAAKRDATLTAVESDRSAVRDAKTNLRDLDAEVIASEVAEVELTGMIKPDVVIADPARSGLGPSASKTLAGLGAPSIVLVSCDPASLARDARLLDGHGYRLREVVVLDLFPQTHHTETVSVFER